MTPEKIVWLIDKLFRAPVSWSTSQVENKNYDLAAIQKQSDKIYNKLELSSAKLSRVEVGCLEAIFDVIFELILNLPIAELRGRGFRSLP